MNLVRDIEVYFHQPSDEAANGLFKIIKEEPKAQEQAKPKQEVTSEISKPENITTEKIEMSCEKPLPFVPPKKQRNEVATSKTGKRMMSTSHYCYHTRPYRVIVLIT
ncbi:Hypothetical predicted protein [Octopus vulgaris]|uniref:Uncharacterized protein n=1 Tax=Octopus vulgaris TaxID=6645 RepID=A0AA36FE36_OCTVU|nr:Hypothetical predicted protein [Octopus vulgaris]